MSNRTAVILNDTRGTWHAGSDACMATLESLLNRAGIVVVGRVRVGKTGWHSSFDDADLVVCNGEGTLHHGAGDWLMETLLGAHQRGQKTALVNALWQPPTAAWQAAALLGLDLAIFRDPISYQMALNVFRAAGHDTRHVHLRHDLSLQAVRDYTAKPPTRDVVWGESRFCKWFCRPSDASQVSLWGEQTMASAVDSLRGAAVYVTGEWHGAYAAAMAGVPPVLVPSNSWKMKGFTAWQPAGQPWPLNPVCLTMDDVTAAIDVAKANYDKWREWRDYFVLHQPWTMPRHFGQLWG